jgi:hypothetical protein
MLACAQPAEPLEPPEPLRTAPAQLRIGVERTRLPGTERMGLVGTSYLIGMGRGLSLGPAIYGAGSGRRGGLFTVGVEAGWQRRIAGPLTLDAGLYAGGGGGGAAPVGGGLMLRPHLDVLWDFGPFLAGVSASRVRFPSGDIDSRQLGLVMSARTDFRYVPREQIGQRSDLGGRTGLGVDRFHTVYGMYAPRPSARRVSGGALPSRIALAGVRAERSLGDVLYAGIEAGGAAGGGVAGYGEFLGTAGVETGLGSDLALGARAALGVGGGGDIDTGGGLLWKAGAYGTVRLTRDLGLTAEAGLVRAPQGTFKAPYASASLNWILDDPSDLTAPPRNTRTEWTSGVERYDAQRRDGTRRPLRTVMLKTSRFLGHHVYVSGQARSAYAGGAGGYTVILAGPGIQVPLAARWHAGVEVLVGAAGGGGVETGGGAVAQPNVYLGYDLSPSLAVRAGASRIRSFKPAGLDATGIEFALACTFGVAGHGYR